MRNWASISALVCSWREQFILSLHFSIWRPIAPPHHIVLLSIFLFLFFSQEVKIIVVWIPIKFKMPTFQLIIAIWSKYYFVSLMNFDELISIRSQSFFKPHIFDTQIFLSCLMSLFLLITLHYAWKQLNNIRIGFSELKKNDLKFDLIANIILYRMYCR